MLYTFENERISITVNSIGAELFSIKSKETGFEYLWQGDPTFWTGRAYNLFPICGRLTDGQYTYKGKTYEMIHHGFARRSEYKLLSKTEDTISFVLTPDDTIKAQYPFDFELVLSYKLEGATVETRFDVLNRGDNELYFSVGGHPGFNVPMAEGLDFEDYYIEFPTECSVRKLALSDTCFMTDNTLPFPLEDEKRLHLKHSLFDNDAIFLCEMPKQVTLKSDKDSRRVTLSYPDMNYLGLWHAPRKPAPYICLEPWYGVPAYDRVVDDLETKRDMVKLKKGESYSNAFSVTVE